MERTIALLLLVFAAMFYRVATDPVRNRELILYGIGLTTAYSGDCVLLPDHHRHSFMWVPWAWADLVFLVVFVVAWNKLGSPAASR